MISEIKLKFGRAPSLVPEVIKTSPVTVFVGPNYSGKSRTLFEIHRYCRTGQKSQTDVIVDEIVFDDVDEHMAKQRLEAIRLQPRSTDSLNPGQILIGKRNTRHAVVEQVFMQAMQNPNAQTPQFCAWFLAYNTLMLDGKSRIDLVKEQPAGDLQQAPQNSLQVLFRDDERRDEVRRIVWDAFRQYFVIDPTHQAHLRIRLSNVAPASRIEERGIHKEAVAFHAAALPIDQASDGVKAFAGIITEVIAGDPKVLLIDEPEAFLHPSLSFNLGKEIAEASLGSDKRVFVATHSPNFVMGCIQSGAPVNIVRLTYRGGVATARILENAEILALMRNPLLRSTGVLSGLFYEFVVVTEADADRAFYQEINERLLRFRPELGIPNCLFLNAQNKQTVRSIIAPLRQLGIPTAAIVDVDIVKEGGSVWTDLLTSAHLPPLAHQPLSLLRAAVKTELDTSGKDMKRDGGIEVLSGQTREAASNLFDQLAAYGIFVVRRGELESWLPTLGATGHGPYWLVDVFERMGEDTASSTYVKPTGDDVWEFIGQVQNWLTDPDRKGIPN